jgi:hypothetical protein
MLNSDGGFLVVVLFRLADVVLGVASVARMSEAKSGI